MRLHFTTKIKEAIGKSKAKPVVVESVDNNNTKCKSKIERHQDGLDDLKDKLQQLEERHHSTKKKLKSILKSFYTVENYGTELYLLLKFSGMGSLLPYAHCEDETEMLAGASCCELPPEHPNTYREQTEEAGLALMAFTLRLEDLAKDQDHVQDLIYMVADYLNRKSSEIYDATLLVSSNSLSRDAIETIPANVFECMWNEFISYFTKHAAIDDSGTKEQNSPIGVPKVVSCFEAVANQLNATNRELNNQMGECDKLLQDCRHFGEKQNRFEKVWQKTIARSLVLNTSEEAEDDVDVLVFLNEQPVATE